MHDIIVIGAGPAGLTAALYALRASKSVLVIEQSTFGGQVTFSPKIENYPGIPEMSGNEFADKLLDKKGIAYEKLFVEDNREFATQLELKQAPTLVIQKGDVFEKIADLPAVKEFVESL